MARNWPGSWKRPYRDKIGSQLWAAQEGRCGCCGEPMAESDQGSNGDLGWSLEHVWPRSRYAYAHSGNIILAHRDCNASKGQRDPNDFELAMLDRVNLATGWTLQGQGPRGYADELHGPSALALAMGRARERFG